MLILISSSAQQRYADDIIRALAHPAGTTFQFRYDKKYVDGLLGQRVLDGLPGVSAGGRLKTLLKAFNTVFVEMNVSDVAMIP